MNNQVTDLSQYGWTEDWNKEWNGMLLAQAEASERQGAEFKENSQPARVIADFGQKLKLVTKEGECWGGVSGKFRHQTERQSDFPAVGDWVMITRTGLVDDAVIHQVLPRRSRISRQAAGMETKEQLIAANVDTLFLVQALNGDYNVRRMERYLTMAWNSGANPVVVLSKSDLCEDPTPFVAEISSVAIGVPVAVISAKMEQGMEELASYLQPGHTIALVGSSGCGKSTMANWLTGSEQQVTQGIREDDSKGRHTTTHRHLLPLASGAVLIDTPGMRELTLWDDGADVSAAFEDIDEVAGDCRYRDCRHENEAGCAVKEAVQNGQISQQRIESFKKMRRELEYQARKEAQKERKRQSGGSAASRRETGWRRDLGW